MLIVIDGSSTSTPCIFRLATQKAIVVLVLGWRIFIDGIDVNISNAYWPQPSIWWDIFNLAKLMHISKVKQYIMYMWPFHCKFKWMKQTPSDFLLMRGTLASWKTSQAIPLSQIACWDRLVSTNSFAALKTPPDSFMAQITHRALSYLRGAPVFHLEHRPSTLNGGISIQHSQRWPPSGHNNMICYIGPVFNPISCCHLIVYLPVWDSKSRSRFVFL